MKVRAILFDCDGTLLDTETQTDETVRGVMARYDFQEVALAPYWTRGRTWYEIALRLRHMYPGVAQRDDLDQELAEYWDRLVLNAEPIPGAMEALKQAYRFFRLALVTSSPIKSVGPLLKRSGMAGYFPNRARICADHIQRSKPDPQGYLLASQRMGVSPQQCLVFEDSRAGLLAARNAGIRTIAVMQSCTEPVRCRQIANGSIQNFEELPPSFWQDLASDKAHNPTLESLPSLSG